MNTVLYSTVQYYCTVRERHEMHNRSSPRLIWARKRTVQSGPEPARNVVVFYTIMEGGVNRREP
jgi:hypothetical protein